MERTDFAPATREADGANEPGSPGADRRFEEVKYIEDRVFDRWVMSVHAVQSEEPTAAWRHLGVTVEPHLGIHPTMPGHGAHLR